MTRSELLTRAAEQLSDNHEDVEGVEEKLSLSY